MNVDIAHNIKTLRQQLVSQQLVSQELGEGSFLPSARAPRLLAVAKHQDVAAIRAALACGQRDFGENYVQEAAAKYPALLADYPDLRLHLTGSLQSNKAEAAVRLFHVIETLDRENLAAALKKAERKTGLTRDYYIEVNLGDEPQKAGIIGADLPAFLARCREHFCLRITGLMGIPPAAKPPAPFFKKLRALCDAFSLPECSMGMSADWAEAIQFGSTEIRLGTAIFGARQKT